MAEFSIGHIYDEAVALYREGKAAAATARFRLLLIADPAHADILHRTALAERAQGAYDSAVRLAGWAARSRPNLFGVHATVGHLRQLLGDIGAAEIAYRKFLSLEPAHGDTLTRMCGVLMTQGAGAAVDRRLRRLAETGEDTEAAVLARLRREHYRRIAAAAADPSLPPGLAVRGVFRGPSGYAFQNRRFVQYLTKAGVRVHLMDLLYEPEESCAVTDDPLFAALRQPVRAKAMITFSTPPMVEKIEGVKTVNYSLIETDRILPAWARHSRTHDHVVVATRSSRDAWIAGGVPPERVSVCPEGVDAPGDALPMQLNINGEKPGPISAYRVRFLNVSDAVPRKNLIGLLRVWLRATRADDDAALILKCGGRGTGAELAELVATAIRQTGVPYQQAGRIAWLDARLSDPDMQSLTAAATHYWSMSHGEGWDLPMAQAGAMGLTLIAPRHSAYLDYLDDRSAHFIPAAPSPAVGPYDGSSWWTPDEDAAVGLIRAIIDNPDAHRRDARAALAPFTWEAAAGRLIDILQKQGAL